MIFPRVRIYSCEKGRIFKTDSGSIVKHVNSSVKHHVYWLWRSVSWELIDPCNQWDTTALDHRWGHWSIINEEVHSDTQSLGFTSSSYLNDLQTCRSQTSPLVLCSRALLLNTQRQREAISLFIFYFLTFMFSQTGNLITLWLKN